MLVSNPGRDSEFMVPESSCKFLIKNQNEPQPTNAQQHDIITTEDHSDELHTRNNN